MQNDERSPIAPKYVVKRPPRDLDAEALIKIAWKIQQSGHLPDPLPLEDIGPYQQELVWLAERFTLEGFASFERSVTKLLREHPKLSFAAAIMPMPGEELSESRVITGTEGSKRFPIMSMSDLKKLPLTEWLIPDVLPKQAVSLLYGDSNTGKTFVMLDMALSLAYGLPWQGRQVEKRIVLYLSAEGNEGLKGRVRAWQKHYGVTDTSRISFICVPVHLMTEMPPLVQTIDEMTRPPELIVLDTFSMTASGINENVNSEVAKYLACTHLLKTEYKAHVNIVHHCGKNGDYRGAAAFRANVDTMMKLLKDEGSNVVKLSCEKQRDRAPFTDMYLQLKVVELEYDERTCSIHTSCVVQPTEAPTNEISNKIRNIWDKQDEEEREKLLDLLRENPDVSDSGWKELAEGFGIKRRVYERHKQYLLKGGVIQIKSSGKGKATTFTIVDEEEQD
jgi:hypothetical protein